MGSGTVLNADPVPGTCSSAGADTVVSRTTGRSTRWRCVDCGSPTDRPGSAGAVEVPVLLNIDHTDNGDGGALALVDPDAAATGC